MSFEDRVEKFRTLAGQAGAQTNEAILNAAVAQGYAGQCVNGALRYLAQLAGSGTQDDINDAMHGAATAAGKSNWADVPGSELVFSASWASYDGSNNGTLQADMLSGTEQRSGWAAPIDDTTALLVQGEGPNGSTKLATRIVTRDGTTASLGSVVAELITGTYTALCQVIKMSATRYLVVARNYDGTDIDLRVFILDQTGAQVGSSVDIYTAGGTKIQIEGLTAHSSTLAVVGYAADVTGYPTICAIDITGDTITLGAAQTIANFVSFGQTNPQALTGTVGHVCYDAKVYRYTVSGTTVTLGNSAVIAGLVYSRQLTIERVDDTHSIICYMKSTGVNARGMAVVVVTDGTTPSVGAETEVTAQTHTDLGSLWSSKIVRAHTTNLEYVVLYDGEKTGDGIANVVTVDPDTYAVTKTPASDVYISSGHDMEHSVFVPFGDSGYGFAFWQDNLNSNAMGGIVLAG